MSRFEPNAEPSMEEILASIRRIIAEDGAGSKAAMPPLAPAQARTDSKPSSTSIPSRGFMNREAFIKPAAAPTSETKERYFTPVTPPSEGDAERAKESKNVQEASAPTATPAAKPESKLEPVQARADVVEDDAAKAEATANSDAASRPESANDAAVAKAETIAADPKPAAKPESKEPEAEARLVAQPSDHMEQKALAPPDRSRIAASIDAQLAELLGDDLKSLTHGPGRNSFADSQPIDVRSEPAATYQPERTARAEPISSPADNHASPSKRSEPISTGAQDAADPFAFDLGPSPFARSSSAAPAQSQMNGTQAHGSRMQDAPREREASDEPHKFVDGNPYKLNGSHASAGAASRSNTFHGPEAPQSVPPSQRQLAPFAVPSVSATLGPQRRLEPLSNAFQQQQQPPRQGPPTSRGYDVARANYEESRDDARWETASEPPRHEAKLPAAPQSGGLPSERTMEDAMADLLRPLLKTWLAENMPKIVERALRREMSERLLPGRDNSND